LAEVRRASRDGADEIDMVIDRSVFLAGDYNRVFRRNCRGQGSVRSAHLKVILETGELQTYDNVRLASEIGMRAGGDFIKTSTGKISPAATIPVTLVMLEAIRDYFYETGVRIGMKPAGGIRNAKQALAYLVMVKETLGDDWLTPDLFRFGASTLVNDVLMQIVKTVDGNYQSADYFSLPERFVIPRQAQRAEGPPPRSRSRRYPQVVFQDLGRVPRRLRGSDDRQKGCASRPHDCWACAAHHRCSPVDASQSEGVYSSSENWCEEMIILFVR